MFLGHALEYVRLNILLNHSINKTADFDAIGHVEKHEPFSIKIRQNGKLNTVDSIIWPWAFPKHLKELLRTQGELIYLKAGESLVLDEYPNQLIILVQGALRVSSHVLKHKHSILKFYFSGDAFEYSHDHFLK